MGLLLHAAAQHIGYFGNRNKGVGVYFLDDGLHLGDLKTVDDKINQGLFLTGVISLGAGSWVIPRPKASESASLTASAREVMMVADLALSRPSTMKSTDLMAAQ